MSYQFAHINTYSRTASKGSSSRWNAQDIADENERKPSACHHVKEPMPPTLLFGVMPSAAVKKAHEWAAQAKDVRGSKLRQDGLCVVAGMISIGKDDLEKWDYYKMAAIEYLQQQHGDRLLSVVEHKDEEYPHIHFYIVPKNGESMDNIHVGLAARNAAKYSRKPTGEQNAAYKKAMEDFQTHFYNNVSSKFGLLRDGPKKERVSRPVWKAQQAAAKLTAQMTNAANAQAQQILLDALTNAEGQGAEYFQQVKAEAEKIRADNLLACEAMTKGAIDKAAAETQAAAITRAEARKEKDEAATTAQAAVSKLAAAATVTAQAAQKLTEADAVKQAAIQTEQEASRKLATAAIVTAQATQKLTEADAVKQAAIQTEQEAEATKAKIDADLNNHKKFVATEKAKAAAERQQARLDGKTEGRTEGKAEGIAEGLAETQKKYGGFVGKFVAFNELVTKDDEKTAVKLDKADAKAAIYHDAMLDERKRANEADKSKLEAQARERETQKALADTVRKAASDKADLEREIKMLKNPAPHTRQSQTNAPAPKL